MQGTRCDMRPASQAPTHPNTLDDGQRQFFRHLRTFQTKAMNSWPRLSRISCPGGMLLFLLTPA